MAQEITIYTQGDKIYCETCKPHGKAQRSTLVVSTYDHYCAGCGEDFLTLAYENWEIPYTRADAEADLANAAYWDEVAMKREHAIALREGGYYQCFPEKDK